MSEFKVGDKVVTVDYYLNKKDLGVGKVYTIETINREFVTLEDRGRRNMSFLKKRFTKIEDNAVNRLLYPEAFSEV